MGNCCGLLRQEEAQIADRQDRRDSFAPPQRQPVPDTPADNQARASAAIAAEARQKQFEKTPGGKAALKSVREAKRPAPNQQIRQDESNARDWLS